MALPHDNLVERDATVCLPCPKCGNIIKSFTVAPTNSRGDTTTVNALCDQCQWSDEAAVPTEDLGLTSLALPQRATAHTRYGVPTRRLDVSMAPGAPAEALEGDALEALIDAATDRHPVLDSPIFATKPSAPAPSKPAHRPDTEPPADDAGAESGLDAADDEDTGALMLEDVAGTPPPMPDPLPKRPTTMFAAKYAPVVRRISTATRQRKRQRSKRSRWEAGVLTAACMMALAAGGLELAFLAHRMTTPQIILVAVFLVPVSVFLVDGLKGLWQDTHPA